MKNKKNILIITILLSITLSSCNISPAQNPVQTSEETNVTIHETEYIQTTAITTLTETASTTTIQEEPPYTVADNREDILSEEEIISNYQIDGLKIPKSNDPIENEIYDKLVKANYLLIYGGNFEWHNNYEFIEKHTNMTIEEFIQKYHKLFTKNLSNKLLDLYGTEDEEYLNLQHTAKDIEEYRNNEFDKYIHFDDLTNAEQYKKYGFVKIGGIGDRGSDLSYNDHELRIISKTENEIIIENTVWHYIPYSISSEDFPDYICHLENGQLIIDSKWNDRGMFISAGELTGTVKEVPVISAYDKEAKRYGEYLEKFQYHVILEDGQWKFDNLELWG